MANYGTKAVDIYQSRIKDPVKSLWRNVLVVAIEDAIKACVMKHRYKADVTFHDLLYITEPNQDFATICHYADLDHNLVRKKVGFFFIQSLEKPKINLHLQPLLQRQSPKI